MIVAFLSAACGWGDQRTRSMNGTGKFRTADSVRTSAIHMAITALERNVFDEDEKTLVEMGVNSFKHFMAYKGA